MMESIINKSVKLSFEVKTYDIDIAGHVNNTVYLKWIEDLRVKLFNKLFNLSILIAGNYYPVVVSTNIVYKKQIKIFNKPAGIIKITDFQHGIFTLKTEIKLNNEISASGEQKCIIFDLKSNKMIREKKLFEIIENIL